MKKFITLIILLFLIITSYSQSYVHRSKYDILQEFKRKTGYIYYSGKVNDTEYIKYVKYDSNSYPTEILIYYFNENDYCILYKWDIPAINYDKIVKELNSNKRFIHENLWEADNGSYWFIELSEESPDRICINNYFESDFENND
jgi:hypothetical protein